MMQRIPCLAAGGPKLTQTLASSETSATSTLARSLYLCSEGSPDSISLSLLVLTNSHRRGPFQRVHTSHLTYGAA